MGKTHSCIIISNLQQLYYGCGGNTMYMQQIYDLLKPPPPKKKEKRIYQGRKVNVIVFSPITGYIKINADWRQS